MPTGDHITLHEAADHLGVHYMTVYRYVRTGRLPAQRAGLQWMIDPADLAEMRAPGRPQRRSGSMRAEGPAKLAARMTAGDEAGAWATVEATLASGVEPSHIYLDFLVPALRAVGNGWATGELTVADEHRAAAVAQRLVGRLGPRFARRGRKRGTIVIGAPPGDQHSLPCAIVGDLLRGAGFDVLDLGGDTPVQSFIDSSQAANRLVAVAIGATTPKRDAPVRATVRALRRAGVTAPILLGGAAIQDEHQAHLLGADHWSGPDGRSAVAAVEEAVRTGRQSPT